MRLEVVDRLELHRGGELSKGHRTETRRYLGRDFAPKLLHLLLLCGSELPAVLRLLLQQVVLLLGLLGLRQGVLVLLRGCARVRPVGLVAV